MNDNWRHLMICWSHYSILSSIEIDWLRNIVVVGQLNMSKDVVDFKSSAMKQKEKKFVRLSVNKLSLGNSEHEICLHRDHFTSGWSSCIDNRHKGESKQTIYTFNRSINSGRRGMKRRNAIEHFSSLWSALDSHCLLFRNLTLIPSAGFSSWHVREVKVCNRRRIIVVDAERTNC